MKKTKSFALAKRERGGAVSLGRERERASHSNIVVVVEREREREGGPVYSGSREECLCVNVMFSRAIGA